MVDITKTQDPTLPAIATATDGVRVEVVEPGSADSLTTPGGPDTSQADPSGQTADSAPPAGDVTAAPAPTVPAPDAPASASDPTAASAAPAAAPAADLTATPTIGAPAVADPALLAALGVAIDTKVEEQVEGVRRTLQGGFDQRAAKLGQQVEAAKTTNASTLAQLREIQAEGMSEEQKTQFLAKSAQDDRAAELKEYEDNLEQSYVILMVQSLVLDYKEYGITAEELEALESPDEMENYCLQKANATLRERADNPAAAAPAAEATSAAATAAPAAPAPAEAQVPAGARAATDIGTGGAGPAPKDEVPASGPGALAASLKDTQWATVRLR